MAVCQEIPLIPRAGAKGTGGGFGIARKKVAGGVGLLVFTRVLVRPRYGFLRHLCVNKNQVNTRSKEISSFFNFLIP